MTANTAPAVAHAWLRRYLGSTSTRSITPLSTYSPHSFPMTWLFRLPGGSSRKLLCYINARDEVMWDKSSLVRGLELKIKLPDSTSTYFTVCFPDLKEDDKLIPQDKQEYVNREGTDFCRARLLLQTSHKCHQHRPYVIVILFKCALPS